MAETEDRLLLLVSDLIAQRKAQGQSLSYNTIKRKILENFSESFFAAHKRKVQNLLEAAERGGNVAPRPSTGNTAESEEILQFEETESNLFQVVNDFIALKKSKNQNISYPTIKRHILKHFSPQFFEKHKSTVQQRLENAFRRDPSNGQFIEDIERQQAPGAVRARTLESIFANMEVVLADMKIRHPYPVSDQYDEVIEQVRKQIGKPARFAQFEAEIRGHLETFRSLETQARAKAQHEARIALAKQRLADQRNRSELRYFTDFNQESIFEEKLTKPSERRRMTNLYAKTKSETDDGSEAAASGNFFDRWTTRKNITKQHKKNFEHIIDRLREGSAMWAKGDRASCLVKLQSICVEFSDVEVWLQTALSDSSRWTKHDKNPNRRECMQILILQEACFALFADTLCTDSKISDELQMRRSIRNILSVGQVLQYFNMDFLRVTYYVRLAMTLRDQYPAMRAHLEQVRLEPDPFMAATMFAFFFEVMLQERPPPDEGSEQSETDLADQVTCDKKAHLVSYYGHMAYIRIRQWLRRRKRGNLIIGRARRGSLFSSATSSPSIKNTHSMHMLPPTSDVTDAQSDNGTAADSQPRRGTPSNAASALLGRARLSSIASVESSASSPIPIDSTEEAMDSEAAQAAESGFVDSAIAGSNFADRNLEMDLRDRSHTTVLIDVNLLVSPADWVSHSANPNAADDGPDPRASGRGLKKRSDTGSHSNFPDADFGDDSFAGSDRNRPTSGSTSSAASTGGTASNTSGSQDVHPRPMHAVNNRNLMEELRHALKNDHVWKIRTLYDKYKLDINDSPISLWLGLGGRRIEFEFIDGRRAAAGSSHATDFGNSDPNDYGSGASSGGTTNFMKLTQKAKYSTTNGCTILHAAILANAQKIMQWALRNNADCFIRHSASEQTALAMLQQNITRSRSARERCERAMASLPPTPVPGTAFGCDSIETFQFLRRCQKLGADVETWLAQLQQGRSVNEIAGVDVEQRRNERRAAQKAREEAQKEREEGESAAKLEAQRKAALAIASAM